MTEKMMDGAFIEGLARLCVVSAGEVGLDGVYSHGFSLVDFRFGVWRALMDVASCDDGMEEMGPDLWGVGAR